MRKQEKPVFFYDGDCAFCTAWVMRWKRVTGDKVTYAPCQEFPDVAPEECARAVQLVMPDGKVYTGAEAVFRALAWAGKKRWFLWLYLHIPGFAPLAEAAYRWIARHRGHLPMPRP